MTDLMRYQCQRMRATLLAAAVWISLCIGLFIGFEGEVGRVAATLFTLYAYASIMLWRTVFASRTAPLELIFWLFHTNFFLLPALSQSLNRSFFWGSYDTYRETSLLYACALVFVGLLAVQVGSRLGRRYLKSGSGTSTKFHLLTARLGESWFLFAFITMALVVLMGVVTVLGPEFFTSNRMSKVGQVESLAELGMLLTLPRALAFGVLLYTVAIFVQKWRQGSAPGFLNTIFLIAAVGINSVVNYPLSLSRFWFFGFLISLIWIVIPLQTKRLRAAFVMGMTLLQFTFFPWYSQITREIGLIGFDLQSIREYVRHGDFDGFQTIVNVTLYVGKEGFEYGRNIISAFLFFVPRAVWEQKAAPLGIAASEFMGYPFTNLSAPIYSEFYADFGLFSLVLGMGLVGFGITRLDSYYESDLGVNRIGIGFLLTSVLAGYLIIILRGSLLGVLPGIFTLLGVLILASMLGRIRSFKD